MADGQGLAEIETTVSKPAHPMVSAAASASVKWVASDHDGLPVKRKQVAQACETCRKRKKRCIHTDGTDGGIAGSDSQHGSADAARKTSIPRPSDSDGGPMGHQSAVLGDDDDEENDEDATQVAANHLMELSSSRFISDLNPEGMFIQAAQPDPRSSWMSYRDKNDLGVWLPPGTGAERNSDDDYKPERLPPGGHHHHPHPRRRRSRNHAIGGHGSGSGGSGSGRPAVSMAAVAYERAKYIFIKECLGIYPPDEDFAVLYRIYCEKVHPILPILKDTDLELAANMTSNTTATSSGTAAETGTATAAAVSAAAETAATGTPTSATMTTPHASPALTPSLTSSVFPIVVKQIIALSAATTDGEAAASHLRLEPHGPLLTAREFHHRLTDAVSTILDADMIAHRFDYIRATILLSFFYQPSTEVDRNKPSFLFTQAAHHFQTTGAHLLGYRPERADDDVDRVFCALWALDRLVSVLYARPCMMHAYDNGKSLDDCIAAQPPCFRLFMLVMLWLDKVIHLYRPRQPFVMIDIPVFEALILDSQAEKLPAMLLGTIEVLYHTVCVLSCRQPLSAFPEVLPDDSHLNRDDRTYLPISIMNPRRSHSSDRIAWVTQTQPICLLPFVPYAVSIALSVQYKKMRYSRTPLFRTRARGAFKDIVALLKSMGDVFVNARVNAALGERIWKEMEKAATSLAREDPEGIASVQNGQAGSAIQNGQTGENGRKSMNGQSSQSSQNGQNGQNGKGDQNTQNERNNAAILSAMAMQATSHKNAGTLPQATGTAVTKAAPRDVLHAHSTIETMNSASKAAGQTGATAATGPSGASMAVSWVPVAGPSTRIQTGAGEVLVSVPTMMTMSASVAGTGISSHTPSKHSLGPPSVGTAPPNPNYAELAIMPPVTGTPAAAVTATPASAASAVLAASGHPIANTSGNGTATTTGDAVVAATAAMTSPVVGLGSTAMTTMAAPAMTTTIMTTTTTTTTPATVTTSAPMLDLSVLDTLDADIDLFGNFDPSFDLGAIDTALEANLDMAMPQNWAPWSSS